MLYLMTGNLLVYWIVLINIWSKGHIYGHRNNWFDRFGNLNHDDHTKNINGNDITDDIEGIFDIDDTDHDAWDAKFTGPGA